MISLVGGMGGSYSISSNKIGVSRHINPSHKQLVSTNDKHSEGRECNILVHAIPFHNRLRVFRGSNGSQQLIHVSWWMVNFNWPSGMKVQVAGTTGQGLLKTALCPIWTALLWYAAAPFRLDGQTFGIFIQTLFTRLKTSIESLIPAIHFASFILALASRLHNTSIVSFHHLLLQQPVLPPGAPSSEPQPWLQLQTICTI